MVRTKSSSTNFEGAISVLLALSEAQHEVCSNTYPMSKLFGWLWRLRRQNFGAGELELVSIKTYLLTR